MTANAAYDVKICNRIKEKFFEQELFRPMRIGRYDSGDRLTYTVNSVSENSEARVDLEIIKFVGGGFAGQVYKIKVIDITNSDDHTSFPIQKGNTYAMKILIPPSGFSRIFRNVLFRIGFQGPFQLQLNPAAVRAGAIWQKFIRKAAKIRFGSELFVNDIHATFIDSTLGSCGEISDWVDGRTWRLEVDDRLDVLKLYLRGKKVKPEVLGSPEYRAKKRFMKEFVELLHQLGAHEFARQYEWSTCKSQPNALKRNDTDNDPNAGLMAVDFRAGLALLPLLPMSPGDIKLIFKGMARGSLVQFDRGNLQKLETFVKSYKNEFEGMLGLLDQLKECEHIYRNSLIDITHNHVRVLYSKRLWNTILQSARTGWNIINKIDSNTKENFDKSTFKTLLFAFLGAIPILGSFIRKLWGRKEMRKHYAATLTSWNYIRRSGKARCAEKAISWYRAGRINENKALKISQSVPRYFAHLPLSILPVGIHRMFSDKEYFKERLFFIFIRPVKLYFSATMREQWLRDMVAEGQAKHILTDKDADKICSQLKEPFIQKYLKSLAVHVCTLPVTQIVSVALSWIYVSTHPQLSRPEAMAAVAAILVLFQVTPVSPGSLARGFYTLYLVIKERNLKDYNIALFLSFFKYIGYLAFPIQMTYRYPEMARFMAGHWSTEAVHIVPVFGERGALLEHWVYRLFYNWPLTIRRRMRKRTQDRANQKPRFWHIGLYTLLTIGLYTGFDFVFFHYTGIVPGLNGNWWFFIPVIFLGAALITIGNGGAALSRRIISGVLYGVFSAIGYVAISFILLPGEKIDWGNIAITGGWYIFLLSVIAVLGIIITEIRLPDPDLKSFLIKSKD